MVCGEGVLCDYWESLTKLYLHDIIDTSHWVNISIRIKWTCYCAFWLSVSSTTNILSESIYWWSILMIICTCAEMDNLTPCFSQSAPSQLSIFMRILNLCTCLGSQKVFFVFHQFYLIRCSWEYKFWSSFLEKINFVKTDSFL